MTKFSRNNGILLHPTSLPCKYGIGELGGHIFDFIDFLDKAKVGLWQVLPLGPTGYGDSPYQSFSSFAGNPLLISVEELIKMNLIDRNSISSPDFTLSGTISYGEVIKYKMGIFEQAFDNFDRTTTFLKEFDNFVSSESYWLEDFAIFSVLKKKHQGVSWSEWHSKYKIPTSEKINNWKKEFANELSFYKFLQFIFNKQWKNVKKYSNKRGIKIIGDIPIFVAYDSTDCWANQEYYLLDENGYPEFVAGVPPDYFSDTGQLWGNPLYNWKTMERDNYSFWVRRIEKTLELVDIIRIDHFRGFEAYWKVPAKETTAINGKWEKGPGMKFFNSLKNQLGSLPLIAEDLGFITDEVKKLRKSLDLPGMKILQYAFGSNKFSSHEYLPHNYEKNCVVYTGTHDNNTTLGWYSSTNELTKKHFLDYVNSTKQDIVGDMIRLAWSSVANFAIIPLQDLLRKGSNARMNYPGTSHGNWQWRFSMDEIKQKHIKELQVVNKLYHRYNQTIN